MVIHNTTFSTQRHQNMQFTHLITLPVWQLFDTSKKTTSHELDGVVCWRPAVLLAAGVPLSLLAPWSVNLRPKLSIYLSIIRCRHNPLNKNNEKLQ